MEFFEDIKTEGEREAVRLRQLECGHRHEPEFEYPEPAGWKNRKKPVQHRLGWCVKCGAVHHIGGICPTCGLKHA